MVAPRFKTPLEAIDAGADTVNQVARTPFRMVGNVAGAIATAAKNVERDIAKPADQSEIPPSPGVLMESVISGVAHAVDGAISTVKGAVDGVMETADGVRREIEQFTGR